MKRQKRFSDLAGQSYQNNIFTFTNFLGEGEQSDFYEEIREMGNIHYEMNGGHADADRLIVRFGDPQELGYEVPWPIVLLKIAPLQKKFSDDLSHRDFLGALMNLGIERDMLGDILVGNNECYVFVQEVMAEYIEKELCRVRHTSVTVSVIDGLPEELEIHYEEKEIQVPSERLDAIVSKIVGLSRSITAEYFHDRKIYVNGRVMENYSHQLSAGSKVSVRGFGKFIYDGVLRHTKSDNLIIKVRIFR